MFYDNTVKADAPVVEEASESSVARILKKTDDLLLDTTAILLQIKAAIDSEPPAEMPDSNPTCLMGQATVLLKRADHSCSLANYIKEMLI